MDDKFKEGFDRMLTGAPEGPSWDQVSTPAASEERPQPTRQRRALVGIGAFVLTVFVIGAVAFLATRDQGAPFAGDTTTTSSASALSETERSSIATWVNGVGLTQVDESVWRRRFDTMCTEGVWHVDVALRLADEYIAADIAAGLSARDESIGDPTSEQGAQTLWIMAAGTCRDAFPVDALDAGPPFMDGTEPVPPMLQTSCGTVSLGEDTTPELPSKPLTPDALAALATTDELGLEGEFFDQVEWFVADDSSPVDLVLFGIGVPDEDGNPSYAAASFEKRDGVWSASGWGGCRIEVTAPGWGGANWVLDPDVPFDPDATEFGILVNERNCANGQPPDGREIRPVVVIEASRVVVHVLVEPVEGDAACPSNPWHPSMLTLAEPLQMRDLYDGREVPFVLVWSSDGTQLGPDDR
jgi:hypothetical protein